MSNPKSRRLLSLCRRISAATLVTLANVSFLAQLALGQASTGAITGTVLDPSSAVIPGAEVQAKGVETGTIYSAKTDSSGLYLIPSVPPGHYDVSVEAEGFKRSEQPNLEIRIGDRREVRFALEVGTSAETVEVSGQAPLLDTETASRNEIISAAAVADLPLLGRNAYLLSTTQPGVVQTTASTSPASNSNRPFDNGGMDSESINGSVPFRNNFTLNGLPNTNQEQSGQPGPGLSAANNPSAFLTFAPNSDTVQEIAVSANQYDAQYGHTGGGTINVNLKSGTNQFHGAAYDYVRNTIFNANSFSNNAAGLPITPYHWNQPGVQIGGPVRIPHLYDGRDKTFFSFSWERIKDAVPQVLVTTVPTALQRVGNFSQTTSGGVPITIYDPCPGSATYATPCVPGGFLRSPFPGNVIPSTRINPIAEKVMSLYPLPNTPGNVDGLFNYTASGPQQDTYDAFTYMVDQAINYKNHVSAFYVQSGRTQTLPTFGFPSYASGAANNYTHTRFNHGGGVTWTSALNSTTIFDFRYGFTRHLYTLIGPGEGYDPTQLGFSPSLVAQLPDKSFPLFWPGFLGSAYAGIGGNGFYGLIGSQITASNTHALQGTLTKVISKHVFKVGGEFDVILDNYRDPFSNSGIYAFGLGLDFTQQISYIPSATQGSPLADMLLGYPGLESSVSANGAFAYSSHYYVGFVQDDWKITPRLTLNLGIRYDVETPATERYNQQNAGFAFGVPSPLQVPGYNLTGGLLFASSKDREPFKTDFNNYQPRIGAAFRLNDKTVLRGGFGVFFSPAMTDNGGNIGYNVSTPYDYSNNGFFTPANNLSNPYPSGILRPSGSSLGLATGLGTSIYFSDPGRTIPKNYQFSFGIQRQLPGQIQLEAAYVGLRAYSLEVNQNIDANSAAQLVQYGTALTTQTVTNPFAGLLPGTSLNSGTVTLGQSLLPYPQYTGVTETDIPIGRSWYNSLQIRVEKRLSHGLFLVGSYTYSKNEQATSFLNPQDGTGESELARYVAPFDITHLMVISGGYEIPLFKNGSGLAHSVFGGWQLNAILTMQSGVPIASPSINTNGPNASSGAYSSGVNAALVNPTSSRWFNTCYLNLSGQRTDCIGNESVAWIQQPADTLTTLSPYMANIRTSVPPNVDLSLFKDFAIRESVKLQIRAEAFNFTNTPHFGAPNTTLTSPAFGVVSNSQVNDPRSLSLAARLTF